MGARALSSRLAEEANVRWPARSAPRLQQTSCSALPSSHSGFVFPLRECKGQRSRDTLPPDRGNVLLDTIDPT